MDAGSNAGSTACIQYYHRTFYLMLILKPKILYIPLSDTCNLTLHINYYYYYYYFDWNFLFNSF